LNKNPDIARQLNRPIIISQTVHDLLSATEAANFRSLGPQRIKGKRHSVNAFGYKKAVATAATAEADDAEPARGEALA
jgi:class 3 adenylate cyclase